MYCDAQKYGNREGTTSSLCAAEGRYALKDYNIRSLASVHPIRKPHGLGSLPRRASEGVLTGKGETTLYPVLPVLSGVAACSVRIRKVKLSSM